MLLIFKSNSFIFSQQNLTFKHFVDAKIDLEVIGSKRSRDLVSKQFDYSNFPRMIYNAEEHLYL